VIALVPVRGGVLPAGAAEAVEEAGGRAWLVGDGVARAAAGLDAATTEVWVSDVGPYRPAAWAAALAPHLVTEPVVLLPASADGRDLAPRLAARLGRPLLAQAVRVDGRGVTTMAWDGRVEEEHRLAGPVVATLVPGVRGVAGRAGPVRAGGPAVPAVRDVRLESGAEAGPDAELVEVLPPDPATVDLAEADRIVAGGAGLGGPDAFAVLASVGHRLGAALGATRVATDAGWAALERQIGTTGVTVRPALYLAFGISGAVQHVTGLGSPDHVVSVNTDPSCPMMALADLAVVSDAPAVVAALAARLSAEAAVVPSAHPAVVPSAHPAVLPSAHPAVVPAADPAVLPSADPADPAAEVAP
jgi:electron transfer flavoprotein alpha subunit